MSDRYLAPTAILDYENPRIGNLIEDSGWLSMPVHERIGAIYTYVRDRIAFGYNEADDISASAVLEDGYGHCNTKTSLLMALLRACAVPCRFHGATIRKVLQKGNLNGIFLALSPKEIVHSWVEVQVSGRWVALEGVILDRAYLQGVREKTRATQGPLLGFAVGTEDIAKPPIDWKGEDTYIQRTGIAKDFGAFDGPDEFYAKHGTSVSGLKAFLFRLIVRKRMNASVERIRAYGKLGEGCPLSEQTAPSR